MSAINHTTGPFNAANVLAILPSLKLHTSKRGSAQETTLKQQITETGLIIWRGPYPVAWIYPGYHNGQSDLKPKHCDFVDVAYHRQTQRGVNLETIDFDDLQEALDFIVETFGAVAANQGGAA